MRIIIILLLIANAAFCQTIPDLKPNQIINGKKEGAWVYWYNAKWKPTTLKDSVAYYRKISFKNDKPIGIVNDFYKSGQKQWEGKLISNEPEVNEGKCTWFYENGNKSSEVNFVNGLKEGEEIDYYEDGKVKGNFKYYSGYLYEKTIVSQLSEYIKILKHYNSFSNKPIKIQKFINNELILEIDNENGDFSSYKIKKKSNDSTLVSAYFFEKKIGKIKILKKDTVTVLNKSFLSEFNKIKNDDIENFKLNLNKLSDSLKIFKNEIKKISTKDLEKKQQLVKKTYSIIDETLFNFFNNIPLMKNYGNIWLFPYLFSNLLDDENFKINSNYYKFYISNIPKWVYYSLDIPNFGNLNEIAFFKEFAENYSNLKKYNFDDSIIYNLHNSFKGLGLYSKLVVKNTISEISNENIKMKYNELIVLYEDKNKLDVENDSFIDDFFEADEKIDNLNEELEKFSLEEKLITKAPSLEKIQNSLKDNEVFIDFYDIKDSYYAAILTNKEEVKWVKLDIDKDFINTILATNKESKINELYSYKNQLLYQKLIQPLESYFTNKQTIIISPDGILHNIAWQAIPLANGILSEQYHLQLVTSSRSLYIKEKPFTDLSSTIFGGIVYDSNEQLEKEALQNKKANDEFIASLFRNTTEKGFNFLKGSETESIEISKIVGTKEDYFFSVDKATEENFRKQHKKSNEILLLSTHGFYFPTIKKDKEEEKDSLLESYQTFKNKNSIIEDPMYRSGLALSLANETWLNRTALPSENDGILLAKDIVGLDLSNTKLVVLSACQTALGDINSGEGVFGLQRAFKQAGVEYIVGSLWEVPDYDTKELMISFFTNLKESKNPTFAMEKARAEMKAKGKSPYQYQGFIVIR